MATASANCTKPATHARPLFAWVIRSRATYATESARASRNSPSKTVFRTRAKMGIALGRAHASSMEIAPRMHTAWLRRAVQVARVVQAAELAAVAWAAWGAACRPRERASPKQPLETSAPRQTNAPQATASTAFVATPHARAIAKPAQQRRSNPTRTTAYAIMPKRIKIRTTIATQPMQTPAASLASVMASARASSTTQRRNASSPRARTTSPKAPSATAMAPASRPRPLVTIMPAMPMQQPAIPNA